MSDIILLGAGPSAASCLYNKETWGVNTTIRWTAKRLDKLFFFDDLETFNPQVMHIDDLRYTSQNVEFISTYKNIKFGEKHGVKITEFPLNEIIRQYNTTYFSNSVSYMIAYAMYTGVESMDLYGIDHMTGESYLVEKSGVEYWLGRAEQAGIKVTVAPGSAILHTMDGKMYGYNTWYEGENPMYNEVIIT